MLFYIHRYSRYNDNLNILSTAKAAVLNIIELKEGGRYNEIIKLGNMFSGYLGATEFVRWSYLG